MPIVVVVLWNVNVEKHEQISREHDDKMVVTVELIVIV